MPKSLSLRFRNTALTLLGLGLGYLTLCLSTQLLYIAYLSGEGHQITSQFLAFSAVCGVIFSGLGGYITAFFARRKPVFHAALFCLMTTVLYILPGLLFGSREPLFFVVLNVAIATTGAMIGGWLRYWQIHSRNQNLTLAES
ncbi:MAG: hypothetical protein AAFQ63_12405 [Cyanobacteria bacterium J06621_11]